MSKKGKRLRGEQNLALIELGCKAVGLDYEVFNSRHCRIYGAITVDYWPTTSRAWIVRSRTKARKMTAREAIELAREVPIVVDEEAARSHMKAIADEGPPPWE